MEENIIALSENDSLKDFYPILVGFKKAILPDNDVGLNIDKRMYDDKYVTVLLPGSSFVATDDLSAETKIGTLITINRTMPKGETQAFFGRSITRVRLNEVVFSNDIPYAKISDFPYEIDCDRETISVYGEIISSGIKKLGTSQNADKIYRDLPPFDEDDADRWINMYGAAFRSIDTNDLFYAKRTSERLEKIAVAIGVQLDQSKIREEIERKVQENIDKSQREYYLREELKVINDELYGAEDENEKYTQAIEALNASDEVKEKLKKELTKMLSLQTGSPESFVCKNYIDTVLALPWGKYSEETVDIEKARRILDEDHFGIVDVKERIIEYLAVHALGKGETTNILCLVGPPGVGKTSIVASIARALGREYIRASLGGVHDEAEIRGHRRTYIGSMPGRIIAGIKKAGTSNPVFLLDEIDKLGADYKGDPSNALLEVLDPKQNSTFQDHYIDLPFDLSKVMFITTANSLSTMSRPLLDRMEIIDLGSYTPEEKTIIAQKFLLPKGLKNLGLDEGSVTLTDEAIGRMIELYTREAGVRKLEQLIGKILRKFAVKAVEGEKKLVVEANDLETYLGIPRFTEDDVLKTDRVGVVHGLAWTENGGDTLDVECSVIKGKDKKIVTGNLGTVMKESVEIAIANARKEVIRENAGDGDLSEKDVFIHFPEGAVPKDGPSAGAAISTAVYSALTDRPVRGDYAITGEITLLGRITPIGGVKEKCLAALRNGIKNIILPSGNQKDVQDIPENLREKIKFCYVNEIREVYSLLIK